MAIINIHNYEEYMIDYLEGNLSSNIIVEMKAFLDVNPDIKEELEGLEDVVLNKDSVSYNDKESLYKNIDTNSFEEKCIAYIEKQINEEDKVKFEVEVSLDEGKKSLLNDFRKTIATADETVVFGSKEILKRNSSFRFKQIMNFSAAAAIIFVFSMSVLLIPNEIVEPSQVSSNTEIFNLPHNEMPKEIIKNPKKTFETKVIEKSIKTAPKTSKKIFKPSIVKTNRVKIRIASNTLNAKPIIKEVDIQNVIASNDMPEIIINNDESDIANNMSNEIALNNNAMKWNDCTATEKKPKRSKNKLLKQGGTALRSFVGKYFYTKKISHPDEIIINEK